MTERDIGEISRPKENATGNYTYNFPCNVWIHKITKGKESNKCDLYKVLWIVENRFTTETTLPKQDYGELARLVSTTWRFMFITGEKNLQTTWDELSAKFKDLQWLNITEDSIWNTTRDREMSRTLTRDELKS